MGAQDQQVGDVSYDARVRGLIAEHGWAVQGVFPTTDAPGVPFAYTVGLTAQRLPELVIYGLAPAAAHPILNIAATRMRDEGPLTPGEPVSRVIDGFDVAVREVSDPTDLAMARRFYGAVQALQLVWPDAHGRFPWHTGYEGPRDAQPLTGRPPAEH